MNSRTPNERVWYRSYSVESRAEECNEHGQRNGGKDLPSVSHGPDEMAKCLEHNGHALGKIRASMTRTAKQYAWRALKRKISDGP